MTAKFTADATSLLLEARGVVEPAKDRGAVSSARAPAEDSFANLVMSRRSIRRYRPEPVDEALVERILAHATWAPSAHNRQPWRFAAVAQTKRRTLADAMAARLRRDRLADGGVLVVGASAGIALIGPLDMPTEVLARADAAMYARKAERRETTAPRRRGEAKR